MFKLNIYLLSYIDTYLIKSCYNFIAFNDPFLILLMENYESAIRCHKINNNYYYYYYQAIIV